MSMLENPVKIDRIELTETLGGKPTISLFTSPLQFPTLILFESQFGLLSDVGIDPNKLKKGAPYYTKFNAFWINAKSRNGEPKRTKKGNQYKLADRLETASRPSPILEELQAIRDLLEELVNQKASPVAEGDLFIYKYADGSRAGKNKDELAAFHSYARTKKHAPPDVATLRAWLKS